jgi:hypothetical protein
MPVFHVYLNGKKVSTAGVGDFGELPIFPCDAQRLPFLLRPDPFIESLRRDTQRRFRNALLYAGRSLRASAFALNVEARFACSKLSAHGPIKLQSPADKERFPSDSKTTGAILRGGMLYSLFQISRCARSSASGVW